MANFGEGGEVGDLLLNWFGIDVGFIDGVALEERKPRSRLIKVESAHN